MNENTDEETVSEEFFPSTFSKTCFIFHKKKRSILKTLLFQYKYFLKLFWKVFISHSIFCHFSINDGEKYVKNFVFTNHNMQSGFSPGYCLDHKHRKCRG